MPCLPGKKMFIYLLDHLRKEYRIKISRMSPNKILMFLKNPSGNAKRQKLTAKHVFECFEKRKEDAAKSKYFKTY